MKRGLTAQSSCSQRAEHVARRDQIEVADSLPPAHAQRRQRVQIPCRGVKEVWKQLFDVRRDRAVARIELTVADVAEEVLHVVVDVFPANLDGMTAGGRE